LDSLFETINKIIHSPIWSARALRVRLLRGGPVARLVLWTFNGCPQAHRRPDHRGCGRTHSLVLPLMGTVIYAILRPAEYLAEARERELETRAMEQELQTMRACPSCGELIKPDYVACPNCRRPLRSICSSCERWLEPGWKLCPSAGTIPRRGGGAAGDEPPDFDKAQRAQ